MKSPSTCSQSSLFRQTAPLGARVRLGLAARSARAREVQSGFTLIEIVITLAIFSFLIGMGLLMTMDDYRGYSFRSERSVIVTLLAHARSRSLANIDQTPWGVCTIGGDYIIFRGTSCIPGLPTNEATPMGSAAVSGLSSGIWFSQLSGTTTGGVIVVTQDGRVATVTVNYEGTILW